MLECQQEWDSSIHLTGVELPEGGELHWADDFASGTRAAAAGGITTVGNITFPRPNEGLEAVLERTAAEVGPLAYVDYALHPVVLDPAHATPDALNTAHADIARAVAVRFG